jgi:arsenate reductase (thioredoxin)
MTVPESVLFVCQHGAAKSVVAARHLERLAAERGLSVRAGAAGVEPDAELPPHVVDGLAREGIDVGGAAPRALTTELLAGADLVVTMGCDVATDRPHVRWDDVPAVSDGYDVARDDIVARVARLLDATR